jgi:PAS domain S-box-containing protein
MNDDELGRQLQRYRRALEASSDGFWERDLVGGTIWYSAGFLALFGFREGELSGERGAASARVHPDDRELFRTAYSRALREPGRFDYAVRFLDAAGRWRWVQGRGRVWPDARGRPAFISGSVSDVHQQTTAMLDLQRHRRALEAQVRERTAGLQAALALAEQRRQEAERANAAKSRFLAQMSHEIRTPLNGVLGLTELALRDAQGADQRRYLTVAHQSGQALLQIISDVLDFSRIESGRVELTERPFDGAQLLAEALHTAVPLARQNALMLMYDWVGPNPLLHGAEGALRQIVTNLLGNAIKFTPAGHVSISAEAQPTGDGRIALLVEVADTGPGIPEAMREQVFEPFEQADAGLSRRHGGTGLGLAIARQLAHALGGTLHLTCPPQGGSRFTLSLTLPLADPAQPGAAVDGSTALPGAGRRAWLVYHEAVAGQWLARRLARLGWTCEVLVGMEAALARARRTDAPAPDLVLLGEAALPPGVDLAAFRRTLPGVPIQLVIRPDWHDPPLAQQAAACDIGTLTGPLTPAQLTLLGRGSAPTPPMPAAAAPVAPRDGAEVLLVEDNAVNQLVGEASLQALGLRVRVAASGAEALEMCIRQPPALVLMDLQMPEMDGLETTRRLLALQREGQWPGAPIVAVTAHATAADRADCLAAGMAGVLTKPLSPGTLRQQLAPWLGP